MYVAQPNMQMLVENVTVSKRGILILKFDSLLVSELVMKCGKQVSSLHAKVILQCYFKCELNTVNINYESGA